MKILKQMKSLNTLNLQVFDSKKIAEILNFKLLRTLTIFVDDYDNNDLDKMAEEIILEIKKTLFKRNFPLTLIFKEIKNLETYFKIT
jgi:hypothetical protein